MEDVLDVYELPHDPFCPVICMDEKPYQLLGEARDSWAMCPGDDKKVDSEYISFNMKFKQMNFMIVFLLLFMSSLRMFQESGQCGC